MTDSTPRPERPGLGYLMLMVGALALIVGTLYHIGTEHRDPLPQPQPAPVATPHDVTPASNVAPMRAPRDLSDPDRAPYGSGVHGGWLDKTPSVSTPDQFRKVAEQNGVLILGDSIARLTSNEFAQRVWDEHGLPTAVYNWPSRPTYPVADWVEEYAHRIPDRGIVIASGSNDIFNPAKWWRQVQRILDVADGKPVYWISVYVDRWGGSTDQRAADVRNSAWVNQQLYAMQVHNPNLIVVDWFAYLSQGYNESNVKAWLSDGVHPTASGVDAWCDLLALRMGL